MPREDDTACVGKQLGEPFAQLVRLFHTAALGVSQRGGEPSTEDLIRVRVRVRVRVKVKVEVKVKVKVEGEGEGEG